MTPKLSAKTYNAHKVLDKAQEALDKGGSSIEVHERAVKLLLNLGLDEFDLRHFKTMLSKVTGVK